MKNRHVNRNFRIRQTVQAIKNWLNPGFFAPLTHNLFLTNGQGVATFTRASTATFTDFEGLLKIAKPGQARFPGARGVENLDANTGFFGSNGLPTGWSTILGTGTSTSETKENYYKIRQTAVAARPAITKTYTGLIVGAKYRFSFTVDAIAIRPTQSFFHIFSGTDITAAFTLTTTTPGRYASDVVTATATSMVVRLGIGVTSVDTGDVTFSEPQLINCTGQANQNPSEYVSNGVLPAPYHGAGVDGVKYFDTYNGNTVSGNLVTEATGAKIPEADLKGVLIEVASTNFLLQSEDFNEAIWTKTRSSIASNTLLSPSGNITADTHIDTIDNNNHSLLQLTNGTGISDTVTYAVYLKKKDFDYYILRVTDNAADVGGTQNSYSVNFNINTGTIDSTSSSGTPTNPFHGIELKENGWYRCWVGLTKKGGATRTDGQNFLFNTSGTPLNPTYIGTGSTGTYIWGAQLESKPMATSYIPTTTATVTRAADVLTFPNAGNVSDTAGTVLMEVTPAFDIPNSGIEGYGFNVLADFGSNSGLIYQYGNTFRHYDGTIIIYSAWIPLNNTTYKIGSRYGSAGQRNWLSGTAGINGAFDGSINSGSNMTIGGQGGVPARNWGGTVKNLKIYKKALSDAQIATLTS